MIRTILVLFFVCSNAFADRRFDPVLYRAMLRTPTEKKQALSTTNTVVKVVQKNLVVTNTPPKTIAVTNKVVTSVATNSPIIQVVETHSIRITGSSDFVSRVNAALTLLKNKDINNYQLAMSNLNGIIENKTGSSNSFVDPPTAITYILPMDSANVFWLASALVHEARHVELFRTKYVYWGTDAEIMCIRRQTDAMKNIGGPQYLINYLSSLDGTHWMKASYDLAM